MALDKRDWVFPAYREPGAAIWRGFPLETLIAQAYGNAVDPQYGRQMPNHFGSASIRYVTTSSPVATQITQAVGGLGCEDPQGGLCQPDVLRGRRDERRRLPRGDELRRRVQGADDLLLQEQPVGDLGPRRETDRVENPGREGPGVRHGRRAPRRQRSRRGVRRHEGRRGQ